MSNSKMQVVLPAIAGFALAVLGAGAGPAIDGSPDRAKTDLDPGLAQIGTLRPRSVAEIDRSNWTLGCETLDRGFADYDEYKAYLVPLGIKTIRLQAGWARTEKVKGTYDFTWLDTIIDDARSRGLNILLETGYGNSIYEGGGGWDLAGGFPTSAEALAAWDRWVEAMATRYKGRVRDWAMWNEPDLNKQHKPEDIAAFNIRTAEIIRRVIPDARIAGLSLSSSDPRLLENCLQALAAQGKVDLFQWFIYHGYEFNPDTSYPKVEKLKATLERYSTKARMRQGENGCPSETAHKFALSNHPWTEYSQAKWDLRRMLGDLGHDVPSSVFTICDFNHTGREINRKGLLRATADKKVEKIKLAYYAVQNTVAVFDDTLERIATPAVTVKAHTNTASFAYRNKSTGRPLVVYWDNTGIPGDAFVTRPAQIEVRGLAFNEPVWVDLVSGRVYAIPADRVTISGDTTTFRDLPLYDAPVLLADKSLLPLQAASSADRAAAVTRMAGCVAFWDFVQREEDGARRFTAHVQAGAANAYPLEAGNYVKDYWGEGREATYDDFPLLGRGPFGQAVRIRKETDPTLRPFLFVPRARLHDTPLDIKGSNRSVTVVVWAIRESGNHALAGIWHEGTDLRQKETTNITRAVRGQRQYGLFAGLNKEGSACGHVSENGASSFTNKYALHKCNSADVSPAVPADSPAEVLDKSWQCFAMTFDHQRHEITGWLNGRSGDRWIENPQKDGLLSYAANAWRQGRLHREPGLQPGEDPAFPVAQLYTPPEDTPVSVQVLTENAGERVEVREYGYTKVEVMLRDGREVSRELVALRLNPWWYPHGIYTPANDGSGGPFTIGRVIHSSRGVGFTGWIGGVAVFDRALSEQELQALAALKDVGRGLAP